MEVIQDIKSLQIKMRDNALLNFEWQLCACQAFAWFFVNFAGQMAPMQWRIRFLHEARKSLWWESLPARDKCEDMQRESTSTIFSESFRALLPHCHESIWLRHGKTKFLKHSIVQQGLHHTLLLQGNLMKFLKLVLLLTLVDSPESRPRASRIQTLSVLLAGHV